MMTKLPEGAIEIRTKSTGKVGEYVLDPTPEQEHQIAQLNLRIANKQIAELQLLLHRAMEHEEKDAQGIQWPEWYRMAHALLRDELDLGPLGINKIKG